jgi:hypothetical protein
MNLLCIGVRIVIHNLNITCVTRDLYNILLRESNAKRNNHLAGMKRIYGALLSLFLDFNICLH